MKSIKAQWQRHKDRLVTALLGAVASAVLLELWGGLAPVLAQVVEFPLEAAILLLLVIVGVLGWRLWIMHRRPSQQPRICELETARETLRGDVQEAGNEISRLSGALTRSKVEARASRASFAQAQESLAREQQRADQLEAQRDAVSHELDEANRTVERLTVAEKGRERARRVQEARQKARPPATLERRRPSPTPPPSKGLGVKVEVKVVFLEQARGLLYFGIITDRDGTQVSPNPLTPQDVRLLRTALLPHLKAFSQTRANRPNFTIPAMLGDPWKLGEVDLPLDQARHLLEKIEEWRKGAGKG